MMTCCNILPLLLRNSDKRARNLLSDSILRYVGHNFALAYRTLSSVQGFDAICNLTVLIRRHEADHFIKVIRARVAFRESYSLQADDLTRLICLRHCFLSPRATRVGGSIGIACEGWRVQRYILNMGVTATNNNPAKRFGHKMEITGEFSGRSISHKLRLCAECYLST
jgi:hypothetical protein